MAGQDTLKLAKKKTNECPISLSTFGPVFRLSLHGHLGNRREARVSFARTDAPVSWSIARLLLCRSTHVHASDKEDDRVSGQDSMDNTSKTYVLQNADQTSGNHLQDLAPTKRSPLWSPNIPDERQARIVKRAAVLRHVALEEVGHLRVERALVIQVDVVLAEEKLRVEPFQNVLHEPVHRRGLGCAPESRIARG